jgi:glutathione S-transferase
MWNRRVELNLYQAVSAVFRHLHPAMKDMEAQVPEWGEANRPRVFEFLGLLDRELKERMFVAGDHYTVADITALVAVDFMRPAKLTMPEEFVNLRRWHGQVGERTSASA